MPIKLQIVGLPYTSKGQTYKPVASRVASMLFGGRVGADLRPLTAMQLDWRGVLIRQPLEGALNHVLSMSIGQLGTGLDDAPACPLGQNVPLCCHVPRHRKG